MSKREDALEIIKSLGLPKQQQNERSCLTLLALAGLTEVQPWSATDRPLHRIWDIMGWMKDHYGKEYAANGITVNGIAPAVIATPMNADTAQEMLDYMISRIPMGRLGTVGSKARCCASGPPLIEPCRAFCFVTTWRSALILARLQRAATSSCN